ncbi:MAG: ATP-binding cassette domain-containing protein [Candidatus Dependentiae bacterium]|nr:ATP-binding cassette domain-containing protein [Candidatus Dependentiae bacterium]
MIKLVDVRKRFGDGQRWITDGINLDIPDGQMTCIIGQSGEGKSVLLKQIIGLIKPTSGNIFIDDDDVTKMNDREHRKVLRKCGYVFQFAALLDSLTVFENIGLSLLENGVPEARVLPIVREKLALVNLKKEVLYKYPSEISGGMQKRVGLARTLISNPSVVLYDEPTTGLDPITSRVVHELMYDMQQRLKITSVIVSHDVEIFKYVDNIALLHQGKIRFFGPAKTIWESTNPYIYQFIRGLGEGPIQTEVAPPGTA